MQQQLDRSGLSVPSIKPPASTASHLTIAAEAVRVMSGSLPSERERPRAAKVPSAFSRY